MREHSQNKNQEYKKKKNKPILLKSQRFHLYYEILDHNFTAHLS